MTIFGIDQSQRTGARVAGFTFLLMMATVIAAQYGISGRLIVAGNTAQTARNILEHERLFRILIASNLIYSAGILVLLNALYVILKPVSPGLAALAATFRMVYALMWVVMALNQFAVLRILSGADYVRAFEPDRLQALAKLFLGANFTVYYAGLPFYGLASAVCCYLWLKSNYIPRAWAVFGLIVSSWSVASGLLFIIFPGFGEAINLYSLDTGLGLFELGTGFWLLFKGLRPPAHP